MRNAFVNILEENIDERTMILVGDLGFGVMDNIQDKFPNQFLNVGVAEQNMTGLATGLALTGYKVFTYSIANFNTLRALEQIRNDIVYHDLNVIVVSVGGGLCYGALGISHHATEDIAILRSLPGLQILTPGDPKETELITTILLKEDHGPTYLRLGRAGEPIVHTEKTIQRFQFKLPTQFQEGDGELAILTMGGMFNTGVEVAKLLNNNKGIKASVYSFHCIKPMERSTILDILNKYLKVVTIEEHTECGGFSSAILEQAIGSNYNLNNYMSFALPSVFTSVVGSQEYLLDHYGLSSIKIYKKIITFLRS